MRSIKVAGWVKFLWMANQGRGNPSLDIVVLRYLLRSARQRSILGRVRYQDEEWERGKRLWKRTRCDPCFTSLMKPSEYLALCAASCCWGGSTPMHHTNVLVKIHPQASYLLSYRTWGLRLTYRKLWNRRQNSNWASFDVFFWDPRSLFLTSVNQSGPKSTGHKWDKWLSAKERLSNATSSNSWWP